MIIHLNGMPGVGKLTIAQILSQRLNAKLVDNHLLIDLVTLCHAHGSPEYIDMLARLTQFLFEEMRPCLHETSFIFTNALTSEMPEDKDRLDSIAQFAKENDTPFIQILLTCALEETKKRIVNDSRKGKGKLRNLDTLEDIYSKYTPYHPTTTYHLELETTDLTAEMTANMIQDYIKQVA